ncbi:hypothetical protein SAQ01S_20330 [Sphingomonas aquatilis NBRC 16722]|nr:hypothetical protein SAQ01S_20330 [Sphingomonas aquatilis NBRC 16722]
MLGALPVFGAGAVVLGELDALAFDMVDGADVDAVRADDLHMFLDVAVIVHHASPGLGSAVKRPVFQMDASEAQH